MYYDHITNTADFCIKGGFLPTRRHCASQMSQGFGFFASIMDALRKLLLLHVLTSLGHNGKLM